MADRWDENKIIETQVEQSPYGLNRLSDTLPGLTDEEKESARKDVRENARPLPERWTHRRRFRAEFRPRLGAGQHIRASSLTCGEA